MIQEDKQISLIDLCARLPHRVKCHFKYGSAEDDITLSCIDNNVARFEYGWYGSFHVSIDADYIKPYLRPMSSMTEEEKDEMFGICTLSDYSVNSDWETVGVEIMSSHPRYGDHYSTDYKVIDWLNKNMFDYRGLIPKGLALIAPEGMYGKEEQK